MPMVFQNNWTPKMMPQTNMALTNDFNNFQLNQMAQNVAPQNQGYPPQQNQGYPPQQNQGYPPQQVQGQGQGQVQGQGYPPQQNQVYPQNQGGQQQMMM
jgi:hypothetical protein